MTDAPLGIKVRKKTDNYILAYQWSNSTTHREVFCKLFEYFEIVPGLMPDSGNLLVRDRHGSTQFALGEGDVFILPDEDFSRAYVLPYAEYLDKFESVH